MRAAIRSALPVLIFVVVVLVVLGVAACTAAGPAGGLQLDRIKLPPGFSISLYADGVPNARSLTLGAAGRCLSAPVGKGRCYALLDRNRDNRADAVLVIAEGLDSPNGVAFATVPCMSPK